MKFPAPLLGLFSAFALSVSAQTASAPAATAAPPAAPAPAAPVKLPQLPTPKEDPTKPTVLRYLNRPDLLNFCTTQVALFNHDEPDVIFLGDSITQGWLGRGKAVWDANFLPLKSLDFGIGGDQTQHVLWRMENYPIARFHPKVAVILIGTNNQSNTPAEIAEGVKAVLTKTQTMYPGIKVIVNSIMPNKRNNARMMAANEIIKTFADDSTVYYLDLLPVMPPVGDNWKGLGPDHLHPDAAGYQIWSDALLPLVKKLLPPASTSASP